MHATNFAPLIHVSNLLRFSENALLKNNSSNFYSLKILVRRNESSFWLFIFQRSIPRKKTLIMQGKERCQDYKNERNVFLLVINFCDIAL